MGKPGWARNHQGLLLLTSVLLAVLAGLTFVLAGGREQAAPGGTTTSAPPQTASASPTATAVPRSDPVLIELPKIRAKSTLVPLGLNKDNTLQVPPVSRPMQAGWFSEGVSPGEIGPAVIAGHVDGNKQPGIFCRLKEMQAGDHVVISRADGLVLTFVVTRVMQVDKDEFPTDAVYGDTSDPQLRLITCGGSFDRTVRSYRDNIIVFAALQQGQ
ncbi:class F sortase [Amycolatopsis alba]|uniref:Class F sortase n=1 Tax=Amycolatopsis alba DSM 44262 TaxID=1125972 RepID=A0A229RGB9_AMYAL|nr:class F sortase [Amycolatopsis alba]OXM45444.1 class F sortase [Amycolatopsis alba DSM 44262]